jgi:hypothetical protein
MQSANTPGRRDAFFFNFSQERAMTRRTLVAALLASVPYLSFNTACGGAEADAKAKFVWRLPSSRIGVAKEYLGENLNQEIDKSSEDDTRGLPLLVIISAIALLPELAEAVVRVYRDYEEGGVLITSKDGALQISTDRRLPPDLVIVKSDQGTTVYQSKHPSADDLLSPMKSILKGEK